METLLLHHHQNTPGANESVLPPAVAVLPPPRGQSPHARKTARSLDALLKTEPAMEAGKTADVFLDDREAFGIFFGLRSALLLYVGVGIAGCLVYEIWSMVTH